MIDENIPEGLSDDTALPAIPADPQLEHLRTPPHSLEAEASVLGGLLLDNSAFDHIADIISDADFYRHEHRLIYAAIAQLIGESKPADAVTANEYLQRQGKSEAAGGLPYLSLLTQQVPSASNIRRYAEIVRERAVLRRLIEAGDAIASSAFNPGARPITQIVDDAESQIDSGSVHNAERYTGRHAERHVGLGGNTAGQEECQGGDKQEKSLHNQWFILQKGKVPSYAIYAK